MVSELKTFSKDKFVCHTFKFKLLYLFQLSCGRRSASLIASFDATNYDQITDKSKLSKSFSNNKDISEFIKSNSNQTKKNKK